MRRAVLVGSVAVGLGALWACSPVRDPFCPNGVWPFDGQTAVPLDAILVVQTGQAIPADAPSLDGTITLTTADGRAVPFHTEVDGPSGEIRVIPDAPLEPRTRYDLGAVDWYQLAEYPHWWGTRDGLDYTITTFATGSSPTLLETHPTGDGETFVVAFSEPVDLDTLEGLLWATSAPSGSTTASRADATGFSPIAVDVELEVLGAFDGDPHLAWVQPTQPLSALDLLELRLDDGGLATSGEALAPGAVSLAPVHVGDVDPLQRYAGAPYCISEF